MHLYTRDLKMTFQECEQEKESSKITVYAGFNDLKIRSSPFAVSV